MDQLQIKFREVRLGLEVNKWMMVTDNSELGRACVNSLLMQ